MSSKIRLKELLSNLQDREDIKPLLQFRLNKTDASSLLNEIETKVKSKIADAEGRARHVDYTYNGTFNHLTSKMISGLLFADANRALKKSLTELQDVYPKVCYTGLLITLPKFREYFIRNFNTESRYRTCGHGMFYLYGEISGKIYSQKILEGVAERILVGFYSRYPIFPQIEENKEDLVIAMREVISKQEKANDGRSGSAWGYI